MTQPERYPCQSRILVVDDEKSTRLVIGRALQLLGYQVDDAGNGKQALESLASTHFDVMLLDLNMPEMNGSQVMDVIRKLYPELQIIVLTAHASLDSAIAAVKTGAVDYLLKPQSIAQIEEAIHRALKRRFVQYQRQHLIDIFEDAMDTLQAVDSLPSQRVSKPSGLSGSIEMNGMLFNPEQRTFITYMGATNTQQPVMRTTELTAHQCAILSYMVLNPHKVLSSLEISSKALGYHNLTNTEADRIIRPHILKLRRKIEANPSNPRLILSVRGKGYLFSPP